MRRIFVARIGTTTMHAKPDDLGNEATSAVVISFAPYAAAAWARAERTAPPAAGHEARIIPFPRQGSALGACPATQPGVFSDPF